MSDWILQGKYTELGEAHVKLVQENQQLKELVREAVPVIASCVIHSDDIESKWLEKARQVIEKESYQFKPCGKELDI